MLEIARVEGYPFFFFGETTKYPSINVMYEMIILYNMYIYTRIMVQTREYTCARMHLCFAGSCKHFEENILELGRGSNSVYFFGGWIKTSTLVCTRVQE